MIICTGYSTQTGLMFTRLYYLFDTNSKQLKQMHETELINSINNGLAIKNLKIQNNKIVGNNININKLYCDGTEKYTVIGSVYDDKNNLHGYDVVNSYGKLNYIDKRNALQAAKYGRVINLEYIEKGDNSFVRLSNTEGINKRTLNEQDILGQYKNMDTNWDISVDTALNIFKANGFKIGYTKDYEFIRQYLDIKEECKRRLYILYDKNKNVIYLERDTKTQESKLCYCGGILIMQSKTNDMYSPNGSSSVDTSGYTSESHRHISLDIREHVITSYREALQNQVPLEYMSDNNKTFGYQSGISTKDIEEYRRHLTEKYSPDDDLAGFGFEWSVFLILEYKNFSKDLQHIFSLLYKNIKEIYYHTIAQDVITYQQDTVKILRNKYTSAMHIANELNKHYGINLDIEDGVKKEIEAIKKKREAAYKEQQQEAKKRQSEAGSITGLFNLFSHK